MRDEYATRLIRRTVEAARPSPIWALLRHAQDSGIISFAVGVPDPALIDERHLSQALDDVLAQEHEATLQALQYGASEGSPTLRNALARDMHRRGATVAPERILVTSGSQQGIDLVARALLDEGDRVIVERPTYPAANQCFALAGAEVHSAPVDRDGIDLNVVEELLRRRRTKMIYTVSTFANPTGTTLSLERRMALLDLASKYGVVVVEDDPYSDLRFEGEALPPLVALGEYGQNWAVYLGSLSKTVSPGLRIGWMVAPAFLHASLVKVKQASDLHTSTFNQSIAAAYLNAGFLERQLVRVRTAYAEKCAAMDLALQVCLADMIDYSRPTGGMFIWGKLAAGIDATELLPDAIRAGVAFLPGAAFYPDSPDHSTLRLSFATPNCAEIEEGISRLAAVVKRKILIKPKAEINNRARLDMF